MNVAQDPNTLVYAVPLGYSQVVFCKTAVDGTLYFNFPRMSSSTAWESWQVLCLFLSLLLILL